MNHPDPAALSDLLAAIAEGQSVSTAEAEELVRADPVTGVLRRLGLAAGGEERLGLFRRAASLCPGVRLEVAGFDLEAQVDAVELWRFYLPVCQAILRLLERAEHRLLIGVTGPGAAGKSVFALLAQLILNGASGGEGWRAALCPLDGFHYPNAYLDSHFITDEAGRRVPLRTVKGAPPSYDVSAFVEALRGLRSQPSLALPRYDRRVHDPVADGLRIGREDRVVLVEGNYLLLDRGRWAEVGGLLDLCLFVSLPLDAAREAMIPRFIRGGRPPEEARRRYDAVDRRNFEIIMGTVGRADLVVRRDAGQRVVAVEQPPMG